MSNSCKYSLNTSVCWGEIISLLRWRIRVLSGEARYYVKCYYEDLKHNYPEFVEMHLFEAVNRIKIILPYITLLNDLRRFLRYSKLTDNNLGVADLISFYNEFKDKVSDKHPDRPDHNLYFYPQ